MGWGSSKTSASSSSETNITNENITNTLNKSINNMISNTVIANAASCSASVSQIQNIDLSKLDVAGDLNISGTNQNQNAALTFDCVQVSTFQNSLASNIADSMIQALKASYDNNQLANMSQAAAAKTKSDAISLGASTSNSSTNNKFVYNQKNTADANTQNIVQSAVTNNLSVSDISDCIAQVKNKQNFSLAGSKVGGSANIGVISQEQSTSLVSSCIQKKDIGSKIASDLTKSLGISGGSSAKSSSTQDTNQTATAETTQTGLLQGFSTVITAVGNVISSIFSGYILSSVAIICVICLCCVACCGIFFISRRGNTTDSINGTSDVNVSPTVGGYRMILY